MGLHSFTIRIRRWFKEFKVTAWVIGALLAAGVLAGWLLGALGCQPPSF